MYCPKSPHLRTHHLLLSTQRGFSLIEVLIALVLITFTAFIFLKATDTLGRIGKSNDQTVAFHIASRKIESLRGSTFDSIPSSGPFTDSQLAKLPRAEALLTVTNYLGNSNTKQIEAAVSWYEQSVQKQVKLITVISKSGLHK